MEYHCPQHEEGKLEPIAVVGLSLRFPENATSADGFWNLMMQKRCVSQSFPEDRINAQGIYHPDPNRHDTVRSYYLLSPFFFLLENEPVDHSD